MTKMFTFKQFSLTIYKKYNKQHYLKQTLVEN